MTTQGNLLTRILRLLDDAGIPNMVVGSLASSFHGEPRQTRDIDLVIDPSPDALRGFVAKVPADELYVDPDGAEEALAQRGSFNVIEIATGWKVDLLLRRDRPFSREEFARRMPVHLLGTDAHIATAEDTILAKLEWGRDGGSMRQLRDVAGILEAQGDSLDSEYLARWVAGLGIQAEWRGAQDAGHAEGT